jgi:hypothetical protein
MAETISCLVTIHGIGFQQAPQGGIPGYADGLHDGLRAQIPDLLGGDPVSEFGRPAGTGAIYVHSDWPPTSRQRNQGLGRLGSWRSGDASHRDVDITGVPLSDDQHAVAHVALVYSHLEDQGPHLGATLETVADTVVSHAHYTTIFSAVRTGVVDLMAVLRRRPQADNRQTPSLSVRADAALREQNPSGLLAVVQQLDHDVTTYVCRNDLRERVRSFVHDAILRIACRPDVGHIVVNAHSQGTVLAYDVLRTLPPFAASKVRGFVTAGSPLRKYADLFHWGTDAAGIAGTRWSNYWDSTDPIADPLAPPAGWRLGNSIPSPTGFSQLFVSIDSDTGNQSYVPLVDLQVDNAGHGAGGGLPAHNYWDNDEQFVLPLAQILRDSTSQ